MRCQLRTWIPYEEKKTRHLICVKTGKQVLRGKVIWLENDKYQLNSQWLNLLIFCDHKWRKNCIYNILSIWVFYCRSFLVSSAECWYAKMGGTCKVWAACSFFHLNQDIAATETKLQNRVDQVVHDYFCVQGIEDEIQQHLHQGHAIHQEDHLYKKWLLMGEHLQLTLTRTMESSVRASFFFLAWNPTRPKMRKCYFYLDRQGELSCVNSYLQKISTLGMTKAYILLSMYFLQFMHFERWCFVQTQTRSGNWGEKGWIPVGT